MTPTGADLIAYLRMKSQENNKLFFSTISDDVNADGLVKYFINRYSEELMYKCLDRYIAQEKEAATTLSKLVLQLGTFISAELAGQDLEDRFQRLLVATRKRMEEVSE